MPSPHVPPGQSPPFEVIDENHRGGVIIIVSACALVLSLAAVLIRVYVRLLLSPPFGLDDLVLLGATIVAVIQSSLIFWSVSRGLGTSIHLLSTQNINQLQRNVAVCNVLYLLTIYLSKACAAGIYLRLTPRRSHQRVLWATISLSTAWLIISIFILTVNCELNEPWISPADSCHELLPRWRFIIALNIITEVVLFSHSFPLVSGLQMRFGRKSVVVMSFAARLPLIAFASLRLHHVPSFTNSANPTLAIIEPYIWTQVEMNYSLAACVAFCLRPYMNAVRTNYGTAGDSVLNSSSSATRTRSSYAHGSKQSSSQRTTVRENLAMRNLKRKMKKRTGRNDDDYDDDGAGEPLPSTRLAEGEERAGTELFNPAGAGVTASTVAVGVSGRQGDESSMASDRSTKMIIRKNAEYSVERSSRRMDKDGYDSEWKRLKK